MRASLLYIYMYMYTGAWGQDTPHPRDLDFHGSWRFFDRNSFIVMYTTCLISDTLKLMKNKLYI